ncbi:tail fiber protein, partial [Haemophilus influenzae]
MALVNKPDESIFASSAKQGEVDNFPDLLRGWGITLDQTQGIPPMEWFNFLFKRLDEKHTYLMQRGLPEWSATQDYTKGSCVQFNGISYRALKNSKNNSPNESDSQYWVRWGFALSEIARATLQQYGIVQLSSATNSDSETEAATSKAVKTAYDKAVEAKTTADGKVGLNGNESINGEKTFENRIVAKRNIRISDSPHYASRGDYLNIGANDGDCWFEYKSSNREIGT